MFKSFEHFGLHTPQIESPAQTSRKDVDKRSKKGWHTITSSNQSDNHEREVITPCTEKSVRVKLEKAIWDIPNEIATKMIRYIHICQTNWYTWFLGVQSVPSLGGAILTRGRYFNPLCGHGDAQDVAIRIWRTTWRRIYPKNKSAKRAEILSKAPSLYLWNHENMVRRPS